MPADFRRSLAVLFLALGLAACGPKTPTPGEVRPTNESVPIPVRVAAAAPRALPRMLRVNGPLVADQQSDVTGVVPGRVTAVLVERGDVVAEGAPLVRLRDVDYRLQAAGANAALQQAQARLGITGARASVRPEDTAEVRSAIANRELADESLRRAEQLSQTGAMSQAELDRARATATAAREQYNSALNGMRGAAVALGVEVHAPAVRGDHAVARRGRRMRDGASRRSGTTRPLRLARSGWTQDASTAATRPAPNRSLRADGCGRRPAAARRSTAARRTAGTPPPARPSGSRRAARIAA